MGKAIKINVKRAEGNYDLGASKFFGAPVVPQAWQDDFHDDIIFMAQIRLADIKDMDTGNMLPHDGYLYFFIDAENYPFGSYADAMVRYYKGEPDMVLDDFNNESPIPEGLNDAYLMTFEACDEAEDGTKLFGLGSNLDDNDEQVLMQYDPLDFDVPFLSDIDGYAYFIFDDDKNNYDDITYKVERS